jgi:hypothetical protein
MSSRQAVKHDLSLQLALSAFNKEGVNPDSKKRVQHTSSSLWKSVQGGNTCRPVQSRPE